MQETEFDLWVRKIPWRRKWQPHSNILAWEIPWTEEPGGLLSIESQRARHDWRDLYACTFVIYFTFKGNLGGELRTALCLKPFRWEHSSDNGLYGSFTWWGVHFMIAHILECLCSSRVSSKLWNSLCICISKFTSDGTFWGHFKGTAPTTAFRLTSLHAAWRFWCCVLVEIQKAGPEAVLKFLKANSEE